MTITVIGNNTGDDFAGTEDTYGRSDLSTSNFGTDTVLKVTKFNASIQTTSLVKFSGLSNIPASDTVSAATLNLNVSTTTVPATTTATVRRILRNWVEAEATWNIYSTGNSWTSGGGRSLGNDISSTSTGTIAIDSTGYQSISTAQLVTDVQGFVDSTFPNYGWHFDRTDTGNDSTSTDLFSSDGTDGSRPYISVTHAAGGRTMGSLAGKGGLAGEGGLAGIKGGLAG